MRLGIAVSDLGPSQLNYFLVRNVNQLLAKDPTADVTVFFENQVANPLPANFALMPMYEMWGFNGVAIATTFNTARKLQSFPAPSHRLFYVWDVEWTRHSDRRTYDENRVVYGDYGLSLLARSESHAKLISECWNRPVEAVIENLDIVKLISHLESPL